MQRSFSSEAIVLKRSNAGEYDRVLTLFTPEHGKLVAIAKGVRRLTSSQRAFLEPGNHVTLFCVNTQSLPLITQTKLLNNFSSLRLDLKRIKKLAEILEIIDLLFPEGAAEPELFTQIIGLITHIDQQHHSFHHVQTTLSDVLMKLGYQDFAETKYPSILEYVAAVAERPVRSYDYLTVKTQQGVL